MTKANRGTYFIFSTEFWQLLPIRLINTKEPNYNTCLVEGSGAFKGGGLVLVAGWAVSSWTGRSCSQYFCQNQLNHPNAIHSAQKELPPHPSWESSQHGMLNEDSYCITGYSAASRIIPGTSAFVCKEWEEVLLSSGAVCVLALMQKGALESLCPFSI